MRLLLRFASLLALLAAIIVGGLDAIRFVASDMFELTSVATALAFFRLDQPLLALVGEGFAATVVKALMAAPAEAIFLALSLFLWLAGYRPHRPTFPIVAPQS